jgi:DNA-binding CsgD family transcriptional regulator
MQERLGRLGIGREDRSSPVVITPAGRHDLTERELQVMAHIARGSDDAETAASLGVSLGAVRYAIRSALAKLGAVNRPHAVARAAAVGVLSFGPVSEPA